MTRRWRLPLFLSGFFLLSQAFPLLSPVRNAATGAWGIGYTLLLPRAYMLFAPFCGIADHLTLLSYHQAVVFLTYLTVAVFGMFGLRRGALALLGFVAFLCWVILIPHPQARLVADDPNVLLIDFHSHTNVSHDGRPSFTFASNMRWHQAQGYGASFITDHNRVESTQNAKALSRTNWHETGYRSLEGEEVSILKTHLVILGNHERIDNRPYDSDPGKIRPFIYEMNKRHIPIIASLPEYWLYHWNLQPPSRRYVVPGDFGHLPGDEGNQRDFIRWGINGFEIINSAPKALDFPPTYQTEIVNLCRSNNLFMTGISDNHGYGYATAAWNAMYIPGWQSLDPDQLEAAVLHSLKKDGFQAVQVLERVRYNPESVAGLLGAPFIDAGLYWRSLQPLESVSWVLWIWLTSFLYSRLCRIKQKQR